MSDFQEELIRAVSRFCLEKIEPHMEKDDHDQVFRKDIFQSLGELGLCGVTIEEKFGGLGLGYRDFAHILEEIAKTSVPYAVTVSVSTMVQSMLQNFGSDVQKKKYLPELSSGQEIGSFCLSESHAGSDASALKTTAKKTENGYLLNGTKMWITSAGVAKTYIVMARTFEGEKDLGISAFIVQDGQKGFEYGKKENKMGWRTSPTRELIFENCLVKEEDVLGKIGDGFRQAKGALCAGRVTIGAISVGLAQRALDESVKYALERKQFNQALFDFQGLQWMMADMATEIEASRLLVEKAGANIDQGIYDFKLAAMAKMKASDTAMKVTTDAVQVHGGVGYTTEYPVERYMRDAKVLQIVEGTNQIQKVVIGKELRKHYS